MVSGSGATEKIKKRMFLSIVKINKKKECLVAFGVSEPTVEDLKKRISNTKQCPQLDE